MTLHYPKADTRTQYFDALFPKGPLCARGSKPKVLLHSVEGSSWPDYRGGQDAPHLTFKCDLENMRTLIRQHFSLDRYARALATSPGLAINDGGALQIEIIGTSGWATGLNPGAPYQARPYLPDLPLWFWDDVAEFLAWAHVKIGVELTLVDGGFVAWNHNLSRMNISQYMDFSGLLGHIHAPKPNNHLDPGAIPGGYIVNKAKAIISGRTHAVARDINDMLALESELKRRGFTIYCGPSDHLSGRCRKGKHSHDRDSMHWQGRAIDVGLDPASGAPISNYERAHLDRLVREIHGRGIRTLWNVAVGNHDDHAHFDGSNWASVINYTGVTGIEFRAGTFPDATGGAGLFTPEYVRRVQTDINTLLASGVVTGFDRLDVDGSLGPATKAAVKKVQRIFGLEMDGLPGPKTRAVLNGALTDLTANSGFSTVYIRQVQTDLNKLLTAKVLAVKGIAALDIDGSLGPLARRVVTEYQMLRDLQTDGLPGPKTRAALDADLKALFAGFTPAYIRDVQADLNTLIGQGVLAVDRLDVDGSLGPLAREAVKAYQRLRNLQADGLPGPATRAALNADVEALAAPVEPPVIPEPVTPEPVEPEPVEPEPVEPDLPKPLPGEALATYRVAGVHAAATADLANTWVAPMGTGIILVLRESSDHPSAVHALARLGRLSDVAILIVNAEARVLTSTHREAIRRVVPDWVVAFGGSAAVTDDLLLAALAEAGLP